MEHALTAGSALEQVSIHTLHRQLGHVSLDSIRNLVRNNAISGVQIIDDSSPSFCDSCEYAKAIRKAIRKERTAPQATAFSDEVHTDWGPSPILSLGGRKYYASFTDDYSRYTRLALLRSKGETLEAYKTFAAWAKTQHGAHIKRLRSDRGGEYTSGDFTKFLQGQGTERRLTTHDKPQHNGVAESLNRRLLERVQAMRHAADLPKNLWGEAINHAVWLRNRTSTWVLGNVTPYERLYGAKPNLGGVPKWGQCVWVHNDMGSKLDAWANKARWVGFNSDSTHAHRIYWPSKNSISVERNIKFVPITVSIYTPPPSYDIAMAPTTICSTAPTSVQPTTTAAPQTFMPTPQSSAPMAIKPTRLAPVVVTPRPTFTWRATISTQAPDTSSELPPTHPPEPALFPSESEGEADDKGEQTPSQTPQVPKKKGKQREDFPKPTRKSHRIPKLSDYMRRLDAGEGTTGEYLDSIFSAEIVDFIAMAIQQADGSPQSIAEAQKQLDWPRWKEAMERELNTLEKAGTWETV